MEWVELVLHLEKKNSEIFTFLRGRYLLCVVDEMLSKAPLFLQTFPTPDLRLCRVVLPFAILNLTNIKTI